MSTPADVQRQQELQAQFQERHLQEQLEKHQEEFLAYFYDEKLFELQNVGVEDQLYGKVDVYTLKAEIVPQCSIQGAYPKWIPKRVAVKTIQLNQQDQQYLSGLINENIKHYHQFHPELMHAYAVQNLSGDVKAFFQYEDYTLEKDILTRRQESRHFDEKLLWKMIYNLLKAQQSLSQINQNMDEIKPSRIFYNNYQAAVLPYGVIPDRHQAARQIDPKFQTFQIGQTILMAGLLLTEAEFNPELTLTYIADLGQRLNSRLFHFTLEVLFLQQDVQRNVHPTEFLNFLVPCEREILFLDFPALQGKLESGFPQVFPQSATFGLDQSQQQQHHHHQNMPFGANIQAITQQIIGQQNPGLMGSQFSPKQQQ